MKRIAIHANDQVISQDLVKQLSKKAKEYGLQMVTPSQETDFVISVGGDGTLLSAFHLYQNQIDHVQFVGVHTGHLGFYTDWLDQELDHLIDCITYSEDAAITYPLLEIEIHLLNGSKKKILALNECSIRSHQKTMVCDVLINGRFFETFRGDGLCVATPTGSTGLNKSLGGAVIHPRVEVIQMTEMASVNNRIFRTLSSPIILPRDEYLSLRPEKSNEWVDVSIDNLFWADQSIDYINLQLAKEKIQFASFKHMHYWDRVASSFIGSHSNE